MNKLFGAIFICALCSNAAAQISDPENPDLNPENYVVDNLCFHVGTYYGLSQPVAGDLKDIAISGPMNHEIAKTYAPMFQNVIERRGLKQYLENDFLVTDLFPQAYTHGKSVFIVYKMDSVIENYLALKQAKADLVEAGNYTGEARRQIASRFGKLLSYSDETIAQYIARNGADN